jgi:hypothetical protein
VQSRLSLTHASKIDAGRLSTRLLVCDHIEVRERRFEPWEYAIGLALTLLSGGRLDMVYAVAIRIGFQQRTYAIPAVALVLNIGLRFQPVRVT